MRITKDPLVALAPGSADELIGVSYLVVGGRCVETPTYFTLERERPIDFVPFDAPAPAHADALRLTSVEREWAEALFAGILGTGGGEGLPPFADVDPNAFWRRFDEAPAPLVRAGLRPMLYALTFLPLASGFRRPFFALSHAERERFLEEAAHSGATFVRQSVVTFKTLACFAYFEDPAVRARFAAAS
jgi:hypothetical protein